MRDSNNHYINANEQQMCQKHICLHLAGKLTKSIGIVLSLYQIETNRPRKSRRVIEEEANKQTNELHKFGHSVKLAKPQIQISFLSLIFSFIDIFMPNILRNL